ncbi:hypothetical protein Q3G72_012329 [Acer saccharum]|nr:hypothetical protein Q3G72_012329 [Acer saccharum]
MFTLFTGSRTPYLRGYVSLYKIPLHLSRFNLGERKTSQTGSGRELAIKTDCLKPGLLPRALKLRLHLFPAGCSAWSAAKLSWFGTHCVAHLRSPSKGSRFYAVKEAGAQSLTRGRGWCSSSPFCNNRCKYALARI